MLLKTPLFPIYTQRHCVTEYLVAGALTCVSLLPFPCALASACHETQHSWRWPSFGCILLRLPTAWLAPGRATQDSPSNPSASPSKGFSATSPTRWQASCELWAEPYLRVWRSGVRHSGKLQLWRSSLQCWELSSTQKPNVSFCLAALGLN